MAGARRLVNEVRAGLEDSVIATSTVSSKVPMNPLDEVTFGKTQRQHLKEFGVVFATLFLIIACSKAYKGHTLSSVSIWVGAATIMAGLGYVAPAALKPAWRAWMKLAHYLSIVMTSVIMGLTWMFGFIPMALLVRALGIKVVDQSYGGDAATYWVKRDPKYDDFKRLKQQY